MPAAAAAATSSGTRTTLSLREYSVCSRRWTKPCVIGAVLILVSLLCQEILFLLGEAAHRAEGAPVLYRRRPPAQRAQVRRRAVALVHGKLVAGVARIEGLHHGIAARLGKN